MGMNRDEYNTLFHKLELNLVAFKRLMDCDEEVLKLVNAAIAAERERIKWDSIHTCNPHCDRPACVAVRRAREDEREMCAKVAEDMGNIDGNMNKTWRNGCFDVAFAIRERGAP
jgi:hypothetical protein